MEKKAPKKKVMLKKEKNLNDFTTCDSTKQMLEKARKDSVETAILD